MKTNKVIVIGGGVSGLSAALYLARAGLCPLVFAGSPPGGQLTLTSKIENFPGQEAILGSQLIANMRTYAQSFRAEFIDENIIATDFISATNKTITASNNSVYCADSYVIATGASALWLGLASETRLRGKGVSICATCDGFFFRNKNVAVVGGGDSAMEEALTLTKFAQKVYLIHRRNQFKASKIMQERVLNDPKILIMWECEVEDIIGENYVTGIKIKSKNNQSLKLLGKNNVLNIDGVFVAIGHKPNTDFLNNSGILLDTNGYIITSNRAAIEFTKLKNKDTKSQYLIDKSIFEANIGKFDFLFQSSTSIKGIFASGDCVDFTYRQASTAAGTGVMAGLDAERYLFNQS